MAEQDKVWQAYFQRLVGLARKKLSFPRQLNDEEDIAASAIKSFLNGVERGRIQLPKEEDFDLWPLLAAIAARKCADLVAYLKAKKRDVSMVTDAEIEEVVGQAPGPGSQAEQKENRQRLLGELKDERSRQIAQWKMERFTNKEIAQKLSCTERTVEREIQLIRLRWEKYIERLWEEMGD